MDVRDLLFTSDFPIDNIVYVKSGSVSVPNGTSDTITIEAHGLPYMPLPMIVWSNTPDFEVSNSFFDTALATSFYTGYVGQQYTAWADPTNIYLQRDNTSGSTQTVYYRIFAFPPSDIPIDTITPSTANLADLFILNTEYNYLKLKHTGKLTSGSPTYAHGLAYAPRVLKWGIINGVQATPIVPPQIINNDPTGSGGFTSGVYVNDSVVGWMNPNTYDNIDFRVYVDS